MSYYFQSGEVLGLQTETVQASSHMSGSDHVRTVVSLPEAPFYFLFSILQVILEKVRRKYVRYYGLVVKHNEADGRKS